MRKIVMQMMTTLNGRLDDPMAWVHGVSDEQYREIERLYSTYDTILIGRTTYEEMAAYWPGALSESVGTATNREMARRMHEYKKLVFSRSGRRALTPWNNAELVVVRSDDELTAYLEDLKAQPGRDIQLAGGATFAQSVIGLGFVDEFRLFQYPIVSPGAGWFSRLPEQRELTLRSASSYDNGVVNLQYEPRVRARSAQPASFTDLLT